MIFCHCPQIITTFQLLVEVTVESPLRPGDKISVDLDPNFVRETLTNDLHGGPGRAPGKFRGKCVSFMGIVNLRPDSFTSMVEKKCEEESYSISRYQDGVYCKIVGVDTEAAKDAKISDETA